MGNQRAVLTAALVFALFPVSHWMAQGTHQVAPAPKQTVDVFPAPLKRSVVLPDGKTPASARRLAQTLLVSRGWHRGVEWKCLNQLWTKESNWRYRADNKSSSAYGIAQILNTPTHLTPKEQILRGERYIKSRYGTPCEAWQHWQDHNWY